ncbi:hypothetical protein [Cesiribacter sp. SM1]|uniref:hypothetical protein n=1 Tax=Cesiribacter sp. SM1 TaxID=2861196 RepID=UPI001CD259DF|nr:hypothetical protein [Cesiribacter sp. SM1]
MLQHTAPILFNALKHHQGYLQQLIRQTPSSIPPHELSQLLLPIGAAQLDFYTGPLTVDAVTEEVKKLLQKQDYLLQDKYTVWISSHKGYRLICLSDHSQWVLRVGNLSGHWVHLHPARYSPHTIRQKAHTLKTALALAILHQQHARSLCHDLAVVNSIRQHLQLPPLSPRQLQAGLQEALQLLL